MAIPVTQVSPVDYSLAGVPNYGSMTEFIISGTQYVLDNVAQVVYEFTSGKQGVQASGPGNLNKTNGSYALFETFLTLNPVTAVVAPPPPTAPAAASPLGIAGNLVAATSPLAINPAITDPAIVQLIDLQITFLRGIFLAVTSLAVQGGQADPTDFMPSAASAAADGALMWQ